MDEMLNTAPCGFFSMTEDGVILETNITLLHLLGDKVLDLSGRHIETILSATSRLLYRSFFLPLMVMHGRADEVFISLQLNGEREVPMLVNAIRKVRAGNNVYDCVLMPMTVRIQYEEDILRARKAAEEAFVQRNRVIVALEDTQKTLDLKQLELMNLNTHLSEMANKDKLTGLWNRRALDDQLDAQIAMAQRMSSPFSILLIDIDRFKKINDSFGHQFGDQVLQTMAVTMEQCVRKTDFTARFGGEEFIVLLPNTDQQGAMSLAEKIRSEIETLTVWEQIITISIGVSTLSHEIYDHKSLLSTADIALYQSKMRGRNCVTFANSQHPDKSGL